MFKYFNLDEFACPCCGESKMDLDFVLKLDKARMIAGIRFDVNSGYRCPKHNVEVSSTSKNHTSGHGADIACDNGLKRIRVLHGLIMAGFKRIGIRKDFIHADDMNEVRAETIGACWLY